MLETLPKAIGKCTRLRILYIDHNKLEELPNEVGQLFFLEELNVRRARARKDGRTDAPAPARPEPDNPAPARRPSTTGSSPSRRPSAASSRSTAYG